MNKTPITIWVDIIEPAIENNKIVVKKGTFYYEKKKYIIENGEIRKETIETNNNAIYGKKNK